MKRFFMFLLFVLLCSSSFWATTLKSRLTPEESKEAAKTLTYYQDLIGAYKYCKLIKPHDPIVKRVKIGTISLYCPSWAIGCYKPGLDTIFYEEGSLEVFGHEYGHAIFYHNKMPFDCWHELILQQRDTYRYFFGDSIDQEDSKQPKTK